MGQVQKSGLRKYDIELGRWCIALNRISSSWSNLQIREVCLNNRFAHYFFNGSLWKPPNISWFSSKICTF
jgi:hypothetical protein